MRKNNSNNIQKKEKKDGFECLSCKKWVVFSPFMGTRHRNHCPYCLMTRHLDLEKSGDRKAKCKGEMKPIGLTFKKEGKDKYGKEREGELMIIHECLACNKISINRIAGDDDAEMILKLFDSSKKLSKEKIEELKREGVDIILDKKEEIKNQLFGKPQTP